MTLPTARVSSLLFVSLLLCIHPLYNPVKAKVSDARHSAEYTRAGTYMVSELRSVLEERIENLPLNRLPWDSHPLFHGTVSEEILTWREELIDQDLPATWADIELLRGWNRETGFHLRDRKYDPALLPSFEDGKFRGSLSLGPGSEIVHAPDMGESMTIRAYWFLECDEDSRQKKRFLLWIHHEHPGSAPGAHIPAEVSLDTRIRP